MAWTGIYVPTIGEFQNKAGTHCNATAMAEANGNYFAVQAESLINCTCRKVFAANTAAFTALPATTKYLLTEVASDIMAIYAISWDMSGFTSRIEAEDMVNILRDAALRGLSILRDKKTQDFLVAGA